MKSFLVFLLTRRLTAKLLLNFFLKLDNQIYKIISVLSISAENGKHPKHEILKYHEWFQDRVDENSVVLDIGCNTGNLLNKLSPVIKKGYGIDILPKLIEEAKSKINHANLEFIHADATSYDYNKFKDLNVITMSNVLEHIDKRVEFLRAIIDSLKGRSSKILIRVPLITRDWLACYKKQRGVDYRLDATHYTEYTEQEIVEELKSADVRVLNTVIKFGEIYLECEVN